MVSSRCREGIRRENRPLTSAAIFQRLGVPSVINACGIYTDLGGSRLSPSVWAAMTESNDCFIDMVELLARTGEIIAGLIGVEAARVTPGASAAIALGIGACLTGCDQERIEALPNTADMPHEVILQRGHRYKYQRCVELAGARIVGVGFADGASFKQIEAAIGPRTAALFVPAHLDGLNGTVPLVDVAAIGHARGIPVFVDAAYMNYPVDLMGSFTRQGADLVCFSAKYFGGPNAAGFLAGRRDLIAAVAALDFTRHESGPYRRFGRAFKLDRQTVVGTVVALEEWLTMDHAARWAGYRRHVDALQAGLAGLPDATLMPMCFTMDERLILEPVNCLVVEFSPNASRSAEQVAAALAGGNPSIRCIVEGNALVIVVETVREGEVALIVERVMQVAGADHADHHPSPRGRVSG
jgi:D-glucosaminate-6-phosphate ammonia-lyase